MNKRAWISFGVYALVVGMVVVWLSGMCSDGSAASQRPVIEVPTEPYCVAIEGLGRTFVRGGASKDDLLTFRASVHNATVLMTNNLPPGHPKKDWRPARVAFLNLGDEVLGTEGEMVCECVTYDPQAQVCEGQCSNCEHCWVPSDHRGGKGNTGGGNAGEPPTGNKPVMLEGAGPLDGPTPPPTEGRERPKEKAK